MGGSSKLIMLLFFISIIINIVALLGGIKAYKMWRTNKDVIHHYLKLKGDIAGIGHYKNANESFKNSNTKVTDGVVFFGASITERMDFNLYFPEKNYINRGLNGQLAPQMLGRFYQDALNLEPKAVVIKICAINFQPHLDESAAYDVIKMMVDLCNSNGIIPILATVIPVDENYDNSAPENDYTKKIMKFNNWIIDYAEKLNIPIIDYHQAMSTLDGYLKSEYSADGIHPNENGYHVMAETANKTLSSLGL